MNLDESFLHDLWDSLKPFVSKKERIAAAEAVVRAFDDYADLSAIEDHIDEFDSVMKAALYSHFEIVPEEEEEEDDWP